MTQLVITSNQDSTEFYESKDDADGRVRCNV